MNIRAATIEDVPEILAIYNDAVLTQTCTADVEPRNLEERLDWYRDRMHHGCPVFVAEGSEGEVVGWSSYCFYHPRPGYRFTVENSVYVAVDRRGQGIGKRLLLPLIESAKTQKLHSIIASIDGDNEASIRLHAGFGFQLAGRLRETVRKFDRWLDVVYMQLLLEHD